MNRESRPEGTFVDIVEQRARELGDAPLYRHLVTGDVDGPVEVRSFARQASQARAVAAHLQRSVPRGARALLVFPPGLEFIDAFLGCLLAGVVAVPAYPPDAARLDRTLPRLQRIASDCGATVVLTTSAIAAFASAVAPAAPELARLAWVATDAVGGDLAMRWRDPGATPDDVALLQYTSGSTSAPKGVVLTHGNLLHNNAMIARGFGHDRSKIGVCWLPLFHDMGLIGHVLQPLFVGFECVFLSPVAFLHRPMRWLRAVSHFRATTSGGPNFAFDLCARKARDADVAALDLSSWQVAFDGAEPVRADTLERFAAAFAPAGFNRSAFYPCYGLAEATLIVTGASRPREPVRAVVDGHALQADRVVVAAPAAPGACPLISSGGALDDQHVVVVDPESCEPCPPGRVGEIWVAGPSVARGYWARPDETRATFGAVLRGASPGAPEVGYLRTGDLGFLRDGELFVAGRRKDLMVFRGRNYYPQDVEQIVEQSHPLVRPGCVAAFSAEVAGQERLVIVAEIEQQPATADPPAVAAAIRGAVAARLDLQPHGISLLRARSIPKTSSGKIQRHACRDGWQRATLETMHAWSSSTLGCYEAPQRL